MSHFTTVETQIMNLVILKEVLKELGYAIKENCTQVRGYQGQLTDAELVIDTKPSFAIGVVKTAKGSFFIGDWDMLQVRAGIEKEELLKAVNKKYAYKTVMTELKKKGYQVVEEKTDVQQTVHVRVRKFS